MRWNYLLARYPVGHALTQSNRKVQSCTGCIFSENKCQNSLERLFSIPHGLLFFPSDCGHPVKDEHDTIKTLEELEDEISEALLGRRETINSVGWLGVRLGDTDLRTQMCRCRMCY